jgi:hypothetical protein
MEMLRVLCLLSPMPERVKNEEQKNHYADTTRDPEQNCVVPSKK